MAGLVPAKTNLEAAPQNVALAEILNVRDWPGEMLLLPSAEAHLDVELRSPMRIDVPVDRGVEPDQAR